jgi:hypothetical protein
LALILSNKCPEEWLFSTISALYEGKLQTLQVGLFQKSYQSLLRVYLFKELQNWSAPLKGYYTIATMDLWREWCEEGHLKGHKTLLLLSFCIFFFKNCCIDFIDFWLISRILIKLTDNSCRCPCCFPWRTDFRTSFLHYARNLTSINRNLVCVFISFYLLFCEDFLHSMNNATTNYPLNWWVMSDSG